MDNFKKQFDEYLADNAMMSIDVLNDSQSTQSTTINESQSHESRQDNRGNNNRGNKWDPDARPAGSKYQKKEPGSRPGKYQST